MKTLIITIIVLIILVIIGVIVLNFYGPVSSSGGDVNSSLNLDQQSPVQGNSSNTLNSGIISGQTVAPKNTSTMDIFAVASSTGELKTFAVALTEAKLSQNLSVGGPYTIFIPTNSAFGKISEQTANQLTSDSKILIQALNYHIVKGNYSSKDLAGMSSVENINGVKLNISTNASGTLMIDNAQIVGSDIVTKNGIIHKIDKVLMLK